MLQGIPAPGWVVDQSAPLARPRACDSALGHLRRRGGLGVRVPLREGAGFGRLRGDVEGEERGELGVDGGEGGRGSGGTDGGGGGCVV